MTRRLEDIFDHWAAKAPVSYAQPTALRLYRDYIARALTEDERKEVRTEVDHALMGEGRDKFDAIAKRIRSRLFPA